MNELIQQIISQLGVDETQAKGGAGLVFKLAQEKLGGDFSKLTSALGGVEDLVKAAPETGGGLAGMAGGLLKSVGAGKLGNLAELAGGFKKLGLDTGMVSKFVPLVLSFVQGKAGADIGALLKKVLQ